MSLKLYNNIAEQLTDQEKTEVVPLIIDCLYGKTEKDPLSAKHISGYLKACRIQKDPARVRKMISYIVCMNLKKGKDFDLGSGVIIGAGNGFFVTSDPRVIEDQVSDLLKRIDNMHSRISSLKAQKDQLIHEQRKIA